MKYPFYIDKKIGQEKKLWFDPNDKYDSFRPSLKEDVYEIFYNKNKLREDEFSKIFYNTYKKVEESQNLKPYFGIHTLNKTNL